MKEKEEKPDLILANDSHILAIDTALNDQQLGNTREFVHESGGTLSCGGAFMSTQEAYIPFHLRYKNLHLSNFREQVLLLKNMKPVCVSSLKESHQAHELLDSDLGDSLSFTSILKTDLN